MLSLGQWHLKAPRDHRQNLIYRRQILTRAAADTGLQRELKAVCREDILFYVNTFVWQYNPQHKEAEIGPFITWDFQDTALHTILKAVYEERDLVIEKSREMGASWLCLIVMDWLWQFFKNKKTLCISRNAEAVDDSDPDSLFWKIDFMHAHLPCWLLDPEAISRKRMYMGNLQTHSTISGEASTSFAGSGGRATFMFIDELAKIREDFEIVRSTHDTSRCRVYNSTHTDPANQFAKLCTQEGMRKIRMHWSQHPEKNQGMYHYDAAKNEIVVHDKKFEYPPDYKFVKDGKDRSPWYDYQCQRRNDPRGIAMDLDIDAQGATAQVFDAATIRRLQGEFCCDPFWEGDLHYDRDKAEPISLIERKGGPLRLWAHPKADGKFPAGHYGVGCDPSTGMGSSPSCLSVFNGMIGEKIGEYANPHILPEELAILAVALCRLFPNVHGDGALLCWEIPGPGNTVGKTVMELGYRNVYYTVDERNPIGVTTSERPGWTNNQVTKRLLIEDYRAALADRKCINRSHIAMEECLFFKYNVSGNIENSKEASKDDPSGARINHGDRAMADAMGWKMVRTTTQQRREIEVKKEITVGSLAWRRQLADNAKRLQQAW